MAALTIRNIDDPLKARLRIRAARHGHSMEEEARRILRRALSDEPGPANLADLARGLFGAGGVDLEPHPAVAARRPPELGS